MAITTFKKALSLLILFSFSVLLSFSQRADEIENFSEEFSVFTTQLADYLKISNNAVLKKSYKMFLKSSDNFTELEKNKVIAISNIMLSKRVRARPYFEDFLQTLVVVKSSNNSDVLLLQWLDVIEGIIELSGKKKMALFCEFTNNLLVEKKLYDSKLVSWSTDSDDFSFSFTSSRAVVNFKSNLTLNCSNKKGDITVYNTKGKYYPLLYQWYGSGGFIYWDNHNFSRDSVYVELSNYNVNTKETQIVADSSILYNSAVFNKGLQGQIINKISSGKQKSKYPSFTSYDKNIEIKNIFENIDYKGGYKLIGKDFAADGGEDAKARMIFKKDDKEIFVANSNSFNIKEERISSSSCGVKIFFDNDSLHHSNLRFKYLNNKRQVQFYRDRKGASNAPMLDTYHQLTIDFELLEWDIDSNIITFGSLPETFESVVRFESMDMFLQSRFDEAQGIDAINPLILISNYVKYNNNRLEFSVRNFARFAGFPIHQIKPYLINLASYGFIFYDFSNDNITVQPILFNYIDAASGIGDYDVISFQSSRFNADEASKINNHIVNAILDLSSKDLIISGIREIELSNKRNVFLFPNRGMVTIKKNRDFKFDGQILAGNGRLNLFGRDFSFVYDDFKVDLKHIDSVQISVPVEPIVLDQYNNEKLTNIRTVFEYIDDPDAVSQGEIRIDHPSNKSGIRKDSFPEFPIFSSFQKSYAYYDGPYSVYRKSYNRDNFFFHLDPYSIDSVDVYMAKGLWFSGSFESAGIFPNFLDTLRVQEDLSFGFKRETPAAGFSIYNDKAKYTNEISLSNQGLKGNGAFEYLTSYAIASDITWFPDSANLNTDTFNIEEVIVGIEFPQVTNTNTYMRYLPYQDELYINMKDTEFNMYGSTFFAGNLLMRPTGLIGDGIMKLDKADVASESFVYNAKWFGSESADLQVFEDTLGFSFKANNLRTHIDLQEREGIFHSAGDDSYVELLANKYMCYIDKLIWDMDNASLDLSNEHDSISTGSQFISIHPDQDSLSFFSSSASYSLKDYIIYANGVDSILVADAVLYPDSGKVIVHKEAVIPTLHNAVLVAGNLTRYHKFAKASVDIISANAYTGSGYYTFIDAMDNRQEMFFDSIMVNQYTITEAHGGLADSSSFSIDSKFDFKGGIDLYADKKHLTFDGYFMMNHNCSLLAKEWVKFRSEIDPNNINITINNQVVNENNETLYTGVLFRKDTFDIYSTFLSKKVNDLDIEMINASHSIIYDDSKSAYIINPYDSLSNTFMLFDSSCRTLGEGNINLNMKLGRIESEVVGLIQHDMKEHDVRISGFLMLNFPFSEKAMESMAEDLGAIGYDEYDTTFARNVRRIIKDQQEAEEYILSPETIKPSNFPEDMVSTFTFSDIDLKWDATNNSFVSYGDIGLGNIYSYPVTDYLTGNIIFEKKIGRSEDALIMRFESSMDEQYCFKYERGSMWSFTFNIPFSEQISKESDAKKRLSGRPKYNYSFKDEDWMEKIDKQIAKKFSSK